MAESKPLQSSPNVPPDNVVPEQQTSSKPSLAEHDVKIESTTPGNCSQFHSSAPQKLPTGKHKTKYKKKGLKKTTTPKKEVFIDITLPSKLKKEVLLGRQRDHRRVAAKTEMYNLEASAAIRDCVKLYNEIEDIYCDRLKKIKRGVEETDAMKITIYCELSHKYREYLSKYKIEGWHDDGTHSLSHKEKLFHLKMLAIIAESGLVACETKQNVFEKVKFTTERLLFVKGNSSQVEIRKLENSPTDTQLKQFRDNLKQIMSSNSFICECAIKITKLQLEVDSKSQKEHLDSLDSNVRPVQHSFRLLFALWAFIFEDVLDRNEFKSTNVCDEFVMVVKESCCPWLDLFYGYINDPANSNSPLLDSNSPLLLDSKSTDFRELDCLANCLQLCILCNVKPYFIKVLEILDKHVKEKGDSFYEHANNKTHIYKRTIESLNMFLGQILTGLQENSSCSTNVNEYKLIIDVIELIKISSNSYYLKSLPNWYLKDVKDLEESRRLFAKDAVSKMAVLKKLAINVAEVFLNMRLQKSHELLEQQFCKQQMLEVELLKGESINPSSPTLRTTPKPKIHEKTTNQTDAETSMDSTKCSYDECYDDEREEPEPTPLVIPMIHAPIPSLTKKQNKTGKVIKRPFIEQCRLICKQETVVIEEVIALHEQWKKIPLSTSFDRDFDESDYYYQGREALNLIIPIIKKCPTLKSIAIKQQLNLINCNFFIGQQQLRMLYANRAVLEDYQTKLELNLKKQPSEISGKLTKEGKLYKMIIRAIPENAIIFKRAFDEISQTLSELPDVKCKAISITSISELSIKEELEKGMSILKNLSTTAACIYKLKGELMKKTLRTSFIPKASDPLTENEVKKATMHLGSIQKKSLEWIALFDSYKQYINQIRKIT